MSGVSVDLYGLSERDVKFVNWFTALDPSRRSAFLDEVDFPRETKLDASSANATESSGHGIGEHDAQAPCGPRPNQETEPSGGAGISPGTLELILLIVLLMIVALGIFQVLRYFFF